MRIITVLSTIIKPLFLRKLTVHIVKVSDFSLKDITLFILPDLEPFFEYLGTTKLQRMKLGLIELAWKKDAEV